MPNFSVNSNQNNVAVITGATKGLGRELSFAFARAGYCVIGLYSCDEQAAESVRNEFLCEGLCGNFIKQDITDEEGWAEFDEKVKSVGKADLTLIANACVPFVPKPFHQLTWSEMSELIDVNVKGTYLTLNRLLPMMIKARSGTVISVLSTALKTCPKGFAAYLTAKSALAALTASAAAEYSERGIRFFSVSPGFMETSLTRSWNDHLISAVVTNSGGIQRPADIAAEILSLTVSSVHPGRGEDYLVGTRF